MSESRPTAYGMLHYAIRKGPWSAAEDALLIQGVRALGGKYATIAREFLGGARTGAQCRERYVNSLDPAVNRAPWSAHEDSLLLHGVYEYGRAYARISKRVFDGKRTDEAVRKRYLLLRQRDAKIKSTTSTPSDSDGEGEDDDEFAITLPCR